MTLPGFDVVNVFVCSACGAASLEDDLQQVQPDGRYCCTICEDGDTFKVLPQRVPEGCSLTELVTAYRQPLVDKIEAKRREIAAQVFAERRAAAGDGFRPS